MHPLRPPAIGQGVQAFLWALFLGGFVFIGMLAIDISKLTSIVTGIVCGLVIFVAVCAFGAERPRQAARSRGRKA
jgi:fucose permease